MATSSFATWCRRYPVSITGFTVPQAIEGSASSPPVLATFEDSDPTVDAGDFTATVQWGDGQSSVETGANLGILDDGDGTFSVVATHVYGFAQPNSIFSVAIVCDHLGGDSRSAPIHIGAAQIHFISGPNTVTTAVEGVPLTVNFATFTAGGTVAEINGLEASVLWGDGTSDTLTRANGGIILNADGSYSAIGIHTYAEEGLTQDPVLLRHFQCRQYERGLGA